MTDGMSNAFTKHQKEVDLAMQVYYNNTKESQRKALDELTRIGQEMGDYELPGGSNPQQYGLPEGATELQDLIEYRNMNFATGNIFKACYRLGECDHSSAQRDLRKIIWFAERELRRVENES